MCPEPLPRARPSRWAVLGVCLGLSMVFVPFTWTIFSVARASDIKGGLRQATVTPGKERQVGAALGGASIAALAIPPGILLSVISGLALMRGRSPRTRRPDG